MLPPPTQYAKCGNINIAYQVFGTGPIDLVYIPGWISNIDYMWYCPELVSFFKELGKIVRVILFDKRGTGLSDRVVELSTLEERMEDINAVMNAVGSKKAVLFGHSEGGSVSALFSVTYPEKVLALITFGIFAKRRFSEDYPWAPTEKERDQVYDMIENNWCSKKMQLEALAPSKANDQKFLNWLTSYFRSGASPSAALKLTKMNTEVNIIDILKYVDVPTLILQRTNDIDVKIEEGRFINKHIKTSKFIELEGSDHLFWIGDTERLLQEIAFFIDETKEGFTPTKKMICVLQSKIEGIIKNKQQFFNKLKVLLNQYNGTLANLEDNVCTVIFNAPGKAIEFNEVFQNMLKDNGNLATSLLNLQEHEISKNYSKIELNVAFLEHDIDKEYKGVLLVSAAVKHLISGTKYHFKIAHSLSKKEIFSNTKMYIVFDELPVENILSTNEYFLESIHQIIEENIDKQSLSVKQICEALNLSERQLQRKLKNVADVTPKQLITSIRLQKAKKLLSNNVISISEVAFKFGFSCPSYFSKCFKKEFGSQPTNLVHKA